MKLLLVYVAVDANSVRTSAAPAPPDIREIAIQTIDFRKSFQIFFRAGRAAHTRAGHGCESRPLATAL
jgi:hypothetical protein